LSKLAKYDQNMASDITITDSGIQALVKNAGYGSYQFDVIALDWQMYSDDAFVSLAAFTSFMNGNGTDFTTGSYRKSITGWWSSEYDSVMTSAFLAATPEERAAALRMAESLIIESSPIIPILYNQTFSFSSEDISGVEIDGYGNFIFTKMELENYELYLPEDDEEEEDPEEEGTPEETPEE